MCLTRIEHNLKPCPLRQDHFAPDKWEKARVDGKKKLKSSAVPSLPNRDREGSENLLLQDISNKVSKVGRPGSLEHSHASRGQNKFQSQLVRHACCLGHL